MVKDRTGKMHPNVQKAMGADKMGATKPPGGMGKPPMAEHGEGEPPEHAFLKSQHDQKGGKHMTIHSHEAGHTTHHIGHDGMVEGPHEHPDMESLKQHVEGTMGEEGGGQEGMEAPQSW